ncbi:helix-turn-helix transcriptional regulator [Sphingobium sp. HBC34]|uniref:Helix-turn-helix transcriptional regulator n=1 Tax=Sphingobium cyanobacteriorum TaxID=3063954 RepID=A0ABT8ZQZ3_9SPHN|nr:helix-turn-helix transcriptional regulator [Sphingobium sp. HBC34]MDO7836970.1 helix-turn-helix transcriptional regulator [Sphingobium sp. HBC34]
MGELSLAPVERLSDRQRECLRLVYQRFTSKEIGLKLEVAPDTVDQHIKRAMRTLGTGSRAEAARLVFVHDQGDTQLLGTQSETIALTPPNTAQGVQNEGSLGHLKRLFVLPPIGGPNEHLTAGKTLRLIAQLALLLGVATAIVVVMFFWVMEHLVELSR